MDAYNNKGESNNYQTVSEALNDLIKRGYSTDFLLEMEHDRLSDVLLEGSLPADLFQIDEVYRFEGLTDPSDESILFAISAKDKTMRGFVLNSFGAEFGYRSSLLVTHLQRQVNK